MISIEDEILDLQGNRCD